jgi:hypothetical protein
VIIYRVVAIIYRDGVSVLATLLQASPLRKPDAVILRCLSSVIVPNAG